MNASLWQLAGWTMIHSLWIGAAVALAGGIVRLAARRAAPSTRYAISLVTLAALAISPLAAATWLSVNGVPMINTVLLPPPGGEGWGGGQPAVNGMQFAKAIENAQGAGQSAYPLLHPSLTLPLKGREPEEIENATEQSGAPTSLVIDLAHSDPSPPYSGERLGEGQNLLTSMPPAAASVFPNATVENPSPTPSLPGRGTHFPTDHQSPLTEYLSRLAAAIPYLPILWLVGAPLTFTLLAAGLVGSERLRRRATPLVAGPAFDACQRMRTALRISRRVALAACDGVAQPVLVGVFRPLILLPTAALAGWTPEQLDMILLHELAHVRRWDNLVNLLQRIIESLLFYHPAVWILSRQVRHDREECCDATVIRHTDQPHQYAELLVSIAAALRGGPAPSLAVASAMASHPLAGRIRRILNIEAEPMRITRRTLAATLLLPLLLAGAILYSGANAQNPPPSQGGARGGIPDASQPSTLASDEQTDKNIVPTSKLSSLEAKAPAALTQALADVQKNKEALLAAQQQLQAAQADTKLSNDEMVERLLLKRLDEDETHQILTQQSAAIKSQLENWLAAGVSSDDAGVKQLKDSLAKVDAEIAECRQSIRAKVEGGMSLGNDDYRRNVREAIRNDEANRARQLIFERQNEFRNSLSRLANLTVAVNANGPGPSSQPAAANNAPATASAPSAAAPTATEDAPVYLMTHPLDKFPENVDMRRWMEIVTSDPRIEIQWQPAEKRFVVAAPKSGHEQFTALLAAARKSMAAGEEPSANAEVSQLQTEIRNIEAEIRKTQEDLTNLEVFRQLAVEGASSPALIEQAIALELEKNETLKSFNNRLLDIDRFVASEESQLADDATDQERETIANLGALRKTTAAKRDAYRTEAAKKLRDRIAKMPNEALRSATIEYNIRRKVVDRKLAEHQQELDAARQRLMQLGVDNHIPTLRDEIRNLEVLAARAQEEVVNLELYKQIDGYGRHPGSGELDQAIAKEMEQDPTVNELRQKLFEQQRQLQTQLAESKNPNSSAIKKLRSAVQLTEAELAKHVQQLEKSLRKKLAHIPADAKAQAEAEYNTRYQAAKENLAKHQQNLAAAKTKLAEHASSENIPSSPNQGAAPRDPALQPLLTPEDVLKKTLTDTRQRLADRLATAKEHGAGGVPESQGLGEPSLTLREKIPAWKAMNEARLKAEDGPAPDSPAPNAAHIENPANNAQPTANAPDIASAQAPNPSTDAWSAPPTAASPAWNTPAPSLAPTDPASNPWGHAAPQSTDASSPPAINPQIVPQSANQPARESSAWNQNTTDPYAGVAQTSPFAPPYHANYATNGGIPADFNGLANAAKNKHDGSITWDEAFTTLHVYGPANLHAQVQLYLQWLSTKDTTNPPSNLDLKAITGRHRKTNYELRKGSRPIVEAWFAEHPSHGLSYHIAEPNEAPSLVARGPQEAHEQLMAALVNLGILRSTSGEPPQPSAPTATPPQSPSFPTLEHQKLADRAYKLLGLELEPLNPKDLERVKKLGYTGGLKVTQCTPLIRNSNPELRGGLLVGLHVWPVTDFASLNEVLQRPDLAELEPLKYYAIIKNESTTSSAEQPDLLISGRLPIDAAILDSIKQTAATTNSTEPDSPRDPALAMSPVGDLSHYSDVAGGPGSANQGGAAPGSIPANAIMSSSDFEPISVIQAPTTQKTGLTGETTTTAYLKVDFDRLSGASASAGGRTTPQEIQRNAMNCLTFVKSPNVLRAALNAVTPKNFTITWSADAVEQLQERLSASFPGDGEILELKLKGDEKIPGNEILLQAIIDAFIAAMKTPPGTSADANAAPTPPTGTASEPTFLYDGKTFEQWRDLWKLELNPKRRVEAIKALTAFNRAGRGREAADAVFEVASQYDFGNYASSNDDDQVKLTVIKLCTDSYGNQLATTDWIPALEKVLKKDPKQNKGLALWLLSELQDTSDEAKAALQTLATNEDPEIRDAAEAARTWPEKLLEKLMKADADGDQQLSNQEVIDAKILSAPNFNSLDKSGDGQLSVEELRAKIPHPLDRQGRYLMMGGGGGMGGGAGGGFF
ncbi:M56 family metallopeptidase [Lacipirellula parvula]|uniref:Peptidase M56 domain-containing protein n=1 Tax=Lacipirellula parvula TaxID=2650471 RepID=A0A5K7XHJ2_9BACT|nr:M56 family metallopeptidase [Lacipirellula parvula]BBO36350.1 hypothetical protein PLANPX_5962 [Lacipirellula parvula]